MPSSKAPTRQAIESAVQRMRSPELAAYFFSRLNNPDWIRPLSERGLFADPPPTGYWPASAYLLRMASHAPSEVASIFSKISTTNVNVIRDMLEAAVAMPPEIAVKLLPTVCRAADDGLLWVNFKDASELCVRLSEAQLDAALLLADKLFAPSTDNEKQTTRRRKDLYWYRDGLQRVVPALAAKAPKRFAERVCDWLKVAVDATGRVDEETWSDGSWWWRPAIEEHEQNRENDLASVLVEFVRRAFETAVGASDLPFDQAIAIVERYPHLIFKRLGLHLVTHFADEGSVLIRSAILDRDLLDDYQFKHEYAGLLRSRLQELSRTDRATWFSWIDAGPTSSDEELISCGEPDDRQEKRLKQVRYWQFEKLHCVRDVLDGDRLRFYEEMLAEHGEPELADMNVSVSTGWGAVSPMTVEQLSEASFGEAINQVVSWKPDCRGFMTPDVEGLISTFSQYIATNPEEFSSSARSLISLPLSFVGVFVDQIARALVTSSAIDIEAVLDLCDWVVHGSAQERGHSQEQQHTRPDEQSAKHAITRFVENVCKATKDDGPRYGLESYRCRLWAILESLCRDVPNSYILRDISREDPRLHEYTLLGINSLRGRAVDAALEYARWVAKHIKVVDNGREVVVGGFDAIQEFRGMIEWQISSDNRSVEALAILGCNVGLINWIDPKWLAANAARLFDLKGFDREPKETSGWAAWNAFLVWVKPQLEFFHAFRSEFRYAVDQSAGLRGTEDRGEQPLVCLGRHLVTLYGRGQLAIDDDRGLLRRFLIDADPDVRCRTISFVGESLSASDDLPAEFVDRFKTLWEFYWSNFGKEDAAGTTDRWLFGPWFASGKFPDTWALDQLEQFVEVSPVVEPDSEVVERLATMVTLDATKGVRILDRMIRGDREGWRVHGWMEDAKTILRVAMDSPGEAHNIANRLIDYLGRRGFTQFGDLLS